MLGRRWTAAITATEWEAFMEDLQTTLDKFAVPPGEQALYRT
jgi:hypothetical protein